MRTRFAILIVAVALAPCARPRAEPGVMSVLSATAEPGEVVWIQVQVDPDIRGVAAFQASLTFDGRGDASTPPLKPVPANPAKPNNGEVSVLLGSIVPEGMLSLASSTAPGKVEIGIVGTRTFNGPGTVVSVPFQVSPNAAPGTVYGIGLGLTALNDAAMRHISAQVRGGTLTVVPVRRLYASAPSGPPGAVVPVEIRYRGGPTDELHGITVVVAPGGSEASTQDEPSVVGVEAGAGAVGALITLTPRPQGRALLTVLSARPLSPAEALANVHIRLPLPADDAAPYPVALTDAVAYFAGGKPMAVRTEPGGLSVVLPMGDLNGDGRVGISDAGICLRIVLGLIQPSDSVRRRADVAPAHSSGVAGDGRVDLRDVIRIVRSAVGLEPPP